MKGKYMEYEYSQLVPELKYLLKDVVRIVDPKQQKLYVKHNLYPVDMYVTTDERTKEDKLVMLFSRRESKPLYELWKNHELK
nr:MAG TPA: hypothetical protein [Caudoviricetes sp.]